MSHLKRCTNVRKKVNPFNLYRAEAGCIQESKSLQGAGSDTTWSTKRWKFMIFTEKWSIILNPLSCKNSPSLTITSSNRTCKQVCSITMSVFTRCVLCFSRRQREKEGREVEMERERERERDRESQRERERERERESE